MSLASVCAELAEVLARPESGIAASLNEPPESIGSFPVSWINPVSGTAARTAGDAMWLHTVQVLVYVCPRRANLPLEFGRAKPLVNSVERTVWEAYERGDAFGPNVSKCVVSGYRLGTLGFGGAQYIGITFTIDVKEHTA